MCCKPPPADSIKDNDSHARAHDCTQILYIGEHPMPIDERLWKIMAKRLGYNEEEAEKFRNDPRNHEIFEITPAVKDKQIILEVVESHGCNSGYKPGDRFYFDYAGNLLTEKCPKRVFAECVFDAGLCGE